MFVCDCPQVPDGFIIRDHREMSNATRKRVSERESTEKVYKKMYFDISLCCAWRIEECIG